MCIRFFASDYNLKFDVVKNVNNKKCAPKLIFFNKKN